jgi:hypothetical protein
MKTSPITMSVIPLGSERRRLIAATMILSMLVLACAATKGARDVRRAQAGFLDDYSILEENPGPGPRLRYLREGADWKRYDKMLLDPVQFWKAPDVKSNQSEAEKQALVNYFHSTFYESMSQYFEMVSVPQPNTMRMSIAFTRLGNRNVTLDTVSTYVPQMRLMSEIKTVFTGKPAFVGEAAFEGKLTDAYTGELLGAAVDKRVGGKTIKGLDSWADVKKAIDYWIGVWTYNVCTLRELSGCKAP